MNLKELRAQYRSDADDRVTPPLFASEDVARWLSEAQEEAAIRKDLLFESSDPTMCSLAVTAGVATYPLHRRWSRITHAAFGVIGCSYPIALAIRSRVELDRLAPDWRTCRACPTFLIVDDRSVTLAKVPEADGTLTLEGYRLPCKALAKDDDEPEIASAHHRHLVLWALYRGFMVPDSEVHDPGRSEKSLAAFESHFGLRVDADRRRDFEQRPMYNKAVW